MMKKVGIVAEYNPFHAGHEYHIQKTRELLGDCAIVCVMSGDFVQRGEPALFSKTARAESACRCGADLVIELPLPWALSSAESFARGAVGLLEDIGAEYISFGSETGDIKAIENAAEALSGEEYSNQIKKILKEKELSYAAAREKALREITGEKAEIIKGANDSLAAEYLKAIKTLDCSMKPLAVKRQGNGHDSGGERGFQSASEIRERFLSGESISAFVPERAAEIYNKERAVGRVIEKELFETAALARLRAFDADYFCTLPDCADGLGDRLYAAVRTGSTLEEIYTSAKTKKYAMSRIRRAGMCALLGISSGMNEGKAPYARLLSANERGCMLLREISDRKTVPLITKPAEIRKYDKKLQDLFAVGVYARDLLSLCYCNKNERTGGKEWQISPKIVKHE